MSIDYSGFVRLVEDNILDITFTKADGTDRNMVCTLNPSEGVVPEIKEGHNDSSKSSVTVWDLEADGWRSFRFANLKRCCVMIGVD